MNKESLKICSKWTVISGIITVITSFDIWSGQGALLVCKELPIWRISFWMIRGIGKSFGYRKLVRSERSGFCDVGIRIFLSSSIFSWSSMAGYLSDFWIFGSQSCLKARFLVCLTAFYMLSREAQAFSFDFRLTFFFVFAITRLFSAWASRNPFQLYTVHSLFQIFFSLLAFICVSLHFSSNPRTDFGNRFALRIARAIAA